MGKKPKIIAWDIESTNLSANIGFCLCIGWKVIGEKKTHLIKISDFDRFKCDPTDDYEVVKAAREVLIDCDGWVTWYGMRFDEPFVNTRLMEHGLHPMPPMGRAHIDGWRIARYKMKLTSNRLATVSAFCGHEEKTPLDFKYWRRAPAGHMPSLKYIYKHCAQDCKVLEQVYETIKPLHTTHFNMGLVTGRSGCPRCGEGKLQKRGFAYAASRRRQRFQCYSCGAWSQGKPEKVVDFVAT